LNRAEIRENKALSAIMARTHFTFGSNYAGWFKTTCGLVGYPDKRTENEFETAENRRFEAKFREWRGVTCKKCLASKKKRAQAKGI
jgi:hypothetical protein